MVNEFKGNYRFLSNFYPCYIEYDGHSFPSAEHAYQAAKTDDKWHKEFLATECKRPSDAKRHGHKVPIRADWDSVKIAIMFDIVQAKFKQNPNLLEKLKATDDEELIEGNWWGDTFWGVCNGVGENHLGKILMLVRGEL